MWKSPKGVAIERPLVPAILQALAPAKINLGLRVVGRRPDGYHLLESVFVPLDLTDQLTLQMEPAGRVAVGLKLEDPDGLLADMAASEENLATRAARTFLTAAGLRADVLVSLRKRIPAGAGLGGGSSDAGAVLRTLRDHWPDALDAAALARVALDLGADVPFFLDPRPALVEGIGEKIEALTDFPALVVLLATPSPPLATAEVFRHYAAQARGALTPAHAGRRMPPATRRRAEQLMATLGDAGRPRRPWTGDPLANDLEPAASQLRPEIRSLQGLMLARGARWAGMSGSGPTVFGIFRERDAARRAAVLGAWGEGVRIHLTQTLASHASHG